MNPTNTMPMSMEELKFIGFSTIFSQSFKTIFTWKKLFTQIILTLILPLAFIFIAHMTISHRFFYQIENNPYQLFSGVFNNYESFHATGATRADLRNYFLFKSITLATITVFSVLSIAAVVYTVASVYTGREVTFRQSLKCLPKVWKRVTVTFICMFITLFAYTLIASVLIFILTVMVGFPVMTNPFFWIVCYIVYNFGFLYLITVWEVASVVSVLESSSGLKAMIKSTDLMAGKRKTVLTMSLLMYEFLICVVSVYMAFVVNEDYPALMKPVWRVLIGMMCGVVVVMVFLLIMVTETFVYLVCKSYHREPIDLVSLSTYLSAYLTSSRPVLRTGEDIQLGRPQNQPVSQV